MPEGLKNVLPNTTALKKGRIRFTLTDFFLKGYRTVLLNREFGQVGTPHILHTVPTP